MIVAILAASLLAAPLTKAPLESTTEVAAPVAQAHRWYGYQTLAADAAAAAFWAGGLHTDLERKPNQGAGGDVLFAGMLTAYLAPAPIIHLAHGNHWRALGSLGVRVGFPILAANIAAAFAPREPGCPGQPLCGLNSLDYAAVGAVIGMGVAAVADAALLGWEAAGPAPRVSLAPAQGPDGSRRGLGLRARW